MGGEQWPDVVKYFNGCSDWRLRIRFGPNKYRAQDRGEYDASCLISAVDWSFIVLGLAKFKL